MEAFEIALRGKGRWVCLCLECLLKGAIDTQQLRLELLSHILELILQLSRFILLAQLSKGTLNLLPVLLGMGSKCGLQLLKALG